MQAEAKIGKENKKTRREGEGQRANKKGRGRGVSSRIRVVHHPHPLDAAAPSANEVPQSFRGGRLALLWSSEG